MAKNRPGLQELKRIFGEKNVTETEGRYIIKIERAGFEPETDSESSYTDSYGNDISATLVATEYKDERDFIPFQEPLDPLLVLVEKFARHVGPEIIRSLESGANGLGASADIPRVRIEKPHIVEKLKTLEEWGPDLFQNLEY